MYLSMMVRFVLVRSCASSILFVFVLVFISIYILILIQFVSIAVAVAVAVAFYVNFIYSFCLTLFHWKLKVLNAIVWFPSRPNLPQYHPKCYNTIMMYDRRMLSALLLSLNSHSFDTFETLNFHSDCNYLL